MTARLDPARLLAAYGTALAAVMLFVTFAVAANNFLNPTNLLNILKQVSFLAILGIGFGLAFTVAELHLSFAAVCSFSCVAVGGLIHHKYPPAAAVAAGLGVGLTAGVINGLLVTRLKIPSLIATLATASVATGLAFAVTGGVAFVGRWDPGFLALGRGAVLGVPVLILWTASAALIALFMLKQTRTGLHLVFTGEADEAARLAGVNIRRMKLLGLALSGLRAGLVGVLLTATLNSAAPNMAGDYLLASIAAVLLGMTMFEPGRCNVPGTLVGAATIGMRNNGLILMGAPYYVQDIMLGIIIASSVALSASTLKKAAFGI
ncbi:MAG: ABC transporter permease [Alphaproteobacteria bacterium]|nr:ABC transporter permease [Alphaproteobacteria bacterium]